VHWGTFEAVSDSERLTEVRAWHGDPEPMPLIGNVASAQHHPARIAVPHVRKGWLDHGPGAPGRGAEPFVPVAWDMVLDLLAGELRRVYRDHGAEPVYGGSYGCGQRGPVPPRAEPGAPVPELPRRLRAAREQLPFPARPVPTMPIYPP
jgi:biotin/methionine sulfoxide reductase